MQKTDPPVKCATAKSTGFTLIEMMVVVCIVGLLASVGLTSFTKYIKMAKAVEAHESLYKLRLGAREYFVIDHWNSQAKLLNRQFPGAVKNIPATGPCCSRCLTPNEEWITSGWNSLLFSLAEAHFFEYRFIATGINFNARYEAQAIGDLDCDDVYSTFEIRGSIDQEGTVMAYGPVITKGLE